MHPAETQPTAEAGAALTFFDRACSRAAKTSVPPHIRHRNGSGETETRGRRPVFVTPLMVLCVFVLVLAQLLRVRQVQDKCSSHRLEDWLLRV